MPATLGVIASQRTAPAAPSIPTTGLAAWWDADDVSTFTYGTGSAVAEWRSRSPATATASQTNASLRPVRNGSVNGRSAVQFNEAATGTGHVLNTTCPADNQLFSMYAVIRHKTQGDVGLLTGNLFGGAPYSPNWRVNTDGRHEVLLPAWGMIAGPSTVGFPVDTTTLISVDHDAVGAWACFVNAAAAGTGTASATIGSGAKLVIGAYTGDGGSYPFNGTVCEMIRYDRVLSTVERQQVENYLASRWFVPTGSTIPTAGLTAWFDADDASTFTFGVGSAVTEWRSKSPATSKLSQTLTQYQPLRNGTLNAHPTVTFNPHALHGNPWPQPAGVESLFIVMVPRALAAGKYVLGCARNAGSLPRELYVTAASKLEMINAGSFATTTASLVVDTPLIYTSLRNVPSHGTYGPVQLYFNGMSNLDTTSQFSGSADGTQDVGGQYHDYPDYGAGNFVGDIAEIVQYNRYLPAIERQYVESHLRTKWGTP